MNYEAEIFNGIFFSIIAYIFFCMIIAFITLIITFSIIPKPVIVDPNDETKVKTDYSRIIWYFLALTLFFIILFFVLIFGLIKIYIYAYDNAFTYQEVQYEYQGGYY